MHASPITIVSTNDSTVLCQIPSSIYSDEMVSGTCTVAYKNRDYKPDLCNTTEITLESDSLDEGACNITELTTEDWLLAGCKAYFTIFCLEGNISINLLTNNNVIKKINGKHFFNMSCMQRTVAMYI